MTDDKLAAKLAAIQDRTSHVLALASPSPDLVRANEAAHSLIADLLRRHDNLTAGLDPASIETFLRVARHLEDRIVHMSDPPSRRLTKQAPVKRIGKTGNAKTGKA